jgi:uncharacterized membrane protein YidH (DUF202 family)
MVETKTNHTAYNKRNVCIAIFIHYVGTALLFLGIFWFRSQVAMAPGLMLMGANLLYYASDTALHRVEKFPRMNLSVTLLVHRVVGGAFVLSAGYILYST